MHILTFDIEDWYHLLEHPSTKTEKNWKNFESRVSANVEKILKILEEKDLKATFFILGWIAKNHPSLVKMIAGAGHELGLHSYNHQLIWQQKYEDLFQDIRINMDVIEEITQQKITLYRAPGFSLKKNNAWAIEVMYSLGITTDASIFPALRAHGGIPDFPGNGPCKISYNGLVIKEFPMNYIMIAGIRTAFSGGGFFRFWPYSVIRYYTKNSSYVMSYLHPRDFDADQPVLKDLSPVRKFRAYYGLEGSMDKLISWITDFDFIDISKADKIVDWNKCRTVELP